MRRLSPEGSNQEGLQPKEATEKGSFIVPAILVRINRMVRPVAPCPPPAPLPAVVGRQAFRTVSHFHDVGHAMPKSRTLPVERIISGGQTGVDRGALDAAMALGIPHGGWCPRGRRGEDGPIPARYQLVETTTPRYSDRTLQNVLDADGTLILFRGRLHGGTELTRRLAEQHGKPYCLVDLTRRYNVTSIQKWLVSEAIRTLNVAGPRESSCPGITDEARRFIERLWSESARSDAPESTGTGAG
jgi:hypothetical protein